MYNAEPISERHMNFLKQTSYYKYSFSHGVEALFHLYFHHVQSDIGNETSLQLNSV